MPVSLGKCHLLTRHASYDCEYFSATKWRTIDGVAFDGIRCKGSVAYQDVGT